MPSFQCLPQRRGSILVYVASTQEDQDGPGPGVRSRLPSRIASDNYKAIDRCLGPGELWSDPLDLPWSIVDGAWAEKDASLLDPLRAFGTKLLVDTGGWRYRFAETLTVAKMAKAIGRPSACSTSPTPGWTICQLVDALAILTRIETFEALTAQPSRTPDAAAEMLFLMTRAFVLHPGKRRAEPRYTRRRR